MRILQLQRRLREVGRIRIGQQVATSNGKSRPAKLEHFRLTSRDRQVIEAAAGVWGGTAQEWKNAPDGPQWEVVTDTDQMSVIVPPGDLSFSQAYEQWSAGGCKVRCDGDRDVIADKPCHCDPEERACDIHTRLSVILPDLPGMGVWRLDTQGYYAAVELGGLVDLLATHMDRGVMLPARLRLEQRSVKRPKSGGGGVETRRFAVPVLDVDVHPLALTGGVDSATGELAAPVRPALAAGALTPVPEVVDGAGAPSIAEQMEAIDQPQPRAARANAARPIPATGIKPRTLVDASEGAAAPALPADVVEAMVATLNALGADARRSFLAEFGVPPGELRLEQLDAAVAFVAALEGPDDPPPDSDGVLPAGPPMGGDEDGGGVGDASAEPSPAPSPAHARGVTVADCARLAGEVFAAEYEAAPRGQKTRTVDRLRHAFTMACTGRVWSAKDCTAEELAVVYQRLHQVKTGAMTYEVTDEGVTFGVAGSEGRAIVRWDQIDNGEAA